MLHVRSGRIGRPAISVKFLQLYPDTDIGNGSDGACRAGRGNFLRSVYLSDSVSRAGSSYTDSGG